MSGHLLVLPRPVDASRDDPVKAVVWHANTQRCPYPTPFAVSILGLMAPHHVSDPSGWPNQLPGSWCQGSGYSTGDIVEPSPPLTHTFSEEFFSPGILDFFVSQPGDGSRLYLLVVVPLEATDIRAFGAMRCSPIGYWLLARPKDNLVQLQAI
ncbi:hypothetical protein CCMA1212_003770 [Trichoderma ghanense]|uniref:Uncharacterized protein n=1 Tax=Trichoderma ghanense TaxID=65468 RepID=A0ABY2HCA1_9HYPO